MIKMNIKLLLYFIFGLAAFIAICYLWFTTGNRPVYRRLKKQGRTIDFSLALSGVLSGNSHFALDPVDTAGYLWYLQGIDTPVGEMDVIMTERAFLVEGANKKRILDLAKDEKFKGKILHFNNSAFFD
jgi:hypothetical protein